MSQSIIGTIDPNSTSGSDLAALLTNFSASLVSGFSGAARPSWAALGTVYLNTSLSPPVYIICGSSPDGSGDIPLLPMSAGTEGYTVTFDNNKILRPTSLAALLSNLSAMTGASGDIAGVKGLVPAPSAGDQNKVLFGNGTWGALASARFPIVTISDNTTLDTTGLAKLYKVTANKTIKLPLGSTLIAGDFCAFEGAFTGRATIQKNDSGSDTIDGASSKTLFAFHRCWIVWNGSAFVTWNEQTGVERDINFQPGNYTFALTDSGRPVVSSGGSPQTFSIPLNSSVAFKIGTQIDGWQDGAGALSIGVSNVAVTLNSEDSKRTLNKRYSSYTLIKRDTDTWTLTGSLKA